jgi:S-adenosylmethionine decarboxylase
MDVSVQTLQVIQPGGLQVDRGVCFVGTHLLLDVWAVGHLDDPDFITSALIECADACGATLLNTCIHNFGDGAGVTGVAILAESHISVHSWPEYGYAAFDVFVCGSLDPYPAVHTLIRRFDAARTNLIEHRRGLLTLAAAAGVSSEVCT